MPYAKAEVRASSWTAQDYQTRLAELRNEWAELSTKDRESDEYKKSKADLFRERDDLDFEYRTVRLQSNELLPVEQRNAHLIALQSAGAEHQEFRSAGRVVVENAEFAEWMANAKRSGTAKGSSPIVEFTGDFAQMWRFAHLIDQEIRRMEAANPEFRTLVETTGSPGLLLPVGQPFLPTQAINQQRLFIRDVIGTGTTTLNAVPYVRELNAATNETAASTVAEAATKPEAVIEFEDDLAPIRDIAITLPVTNQMFEDAAVVMSYINTRLSYMLALREEKEILDGNGLAPDLKGIRTYTGTQTQAFTTDVAITLGNAIAKVVNADGYPNAIAINPLKSWAMKIQRAAGGSGTFDAGTPFSAVVNTAWGVPLIETRSMGTNEALVGDYRLGAQVWDRSQARVQTFEQHSDFAAKNKRLIRAEKRLGLAVYRPDWFVETATA